MSHATPTTTAATTAHRIVIHPIDRIGSYRVTDRETGQEWVARARVPACSVARVLLDLGASPSDRLEVFREGRDQPCSTGSLGWYADRTVRETPRQGPTFAKYQPFDGSRLT